MVSARILGILFYLHIKTPMSSEYAKNLRSMPLLVAETKAKKYSKTQEATFKFLAQGELKFPILMDLFTNAYTKTSLNNGNPEDRV